MSDAGHRLAGKIQFEGAGGIRLAGESTGFPDHPLVLLLPSIGQTCEIWRDVAIGLAESGRHVISLDLRGHGASGRSPTGEYDLVDYAADIRAVLAQLPSRPAIVGAFTGGLAAMLALADAESELATGLVVLGLLPLADPQKAKLLANAAQELRAKQGGVASIDDAIRLLTTLHPDRPLPSRKFVEYLLEQDGDGAWTWRWDLRALEGRDFDAEASRLMEVAPQLNVPVLFFHDDQGETDTTEKIRLLAALVAGSEIKRIDATPQFFAAERADTLASILVEFLESAAPRIPIRYEEGSATRVLRDALACFVTGVTVVTTVDESGRPIGLTANSFTSVSLDPPLILFCLSKNSTNLAHFEKSDRFAVNVLHTGQQPVSQCFARPGEDRFKGIAWHRWNDGAPILTGCLASLDCTKYATYDGGDHIIFVGRVARARFEPHRDPLLFFRGRYRRLHFA